MCPVRIGLGELRRQRGTERKVFCEYRRSRRRFAVRDWYTANITGPKHERYARGKLDFFAVYLVPVDVWYIIPFDVVEGNLSLNLTPRRGHKFSQYMEDWNLLRGSEKKTKAPAAGISTR